MSVVDKPSHYRQGTIECIDYLKSVLSREEFIGYLRGNIMKYNHRWPHKNGLEDLQKAQWYQNYLVAYIEEEGKQRERI